MYENIAESIDEGKPDGLEFWLCSHYVPSLDYGRYAAAFGTVLCSMCVSSSAWYHAVMDPGGSGPSLEVFSETHGSNRVACEAVLEDHRGLARGSSGRRGQWATRCHSRRGLLSVALLPWETKDFFILFF